MQCPYCGKIVHACTPPSDKPLPPHIPMLCTTCGKICVLFEMREILKPTDKALAVIMESDVYKQHMAPLQRQIRIRFN